MDNADGWDDLKLALGGVSLASGIVELGVELLIWGLVGDGDMAAAMTTRSGFGAVSNLADRLIRVVITDQETANRAFEATAMARRAIEGRNSILHSVWLAKAEESGDLARLSRTFKDGKLRVAADDRTIGDLRKVEEELEAASLALTALIGDSFKAGKSRRMRLLEISEIPPDKSDS